VADLVLPLAMISLYEFAQRRNEVVEEKAQRRAALHQEQENDNDG
jgi:hypothetical protein